MQKTPRPEYEALDGIGLPYIRKAELIGELPLELVKDALVEATAEISKIVGVEAVSVAKFGTPAFVALKGMNRHIAKRHVKSKLLLACGHDLPLHLCPSFEA